MRVLLIGGTSHAGKSSVARALANREGWIHRSTDHLARHPGRPWGEVPTHVPEHYLTLDMGALMASVLAHYRKLWPEIEALVAKHANDESTPRLVLEGSALLPENLARLVRPSVRVIWLSVKDNAATQRIRDSSDHADRSEREKAAIDKFIARTLAFNQVMTEEASALGLATIESTDGVDRLAQHSWARAEQMEPHK
jgi:2-phosphoglycerate kinase